MLASAFSLNHYYVAVSRLGEQTDLQKHSPQRGKHAGWPAYLLLAAYLRCYSPLLLLLEDQLLCLPLMACLQTSMLNLHATSCTMYLLLSQQRKEKKKRRRREMKREGGRKEGKYKRKKKK